MYAVFTVPVMESKHGTLIRTTLTAAEWARVKRIAKKRDLSASQLVAHTIREHLLTSGGAR